MKKKRKFQRPKAGLRALVPAGQVSYTGVRVTKGFVYEKLRYTVLTISQMSRNDRELVQATLKTLTTGPEAMTLPDGKNGWACMELDQRGRAYLLSYRGMEV